jgi:hypothetical protein
MMVPIGDVLNHIAKNNAHLVFEDTELLICSTKEIKKVRIASLFNSDNG